MLLNILCHRILAVAVAVDGLDEYANFIFLKVCMEREKIGRYTRNKIRLEYQLVSLIEGFRDTHVGLCVPPRVERLEFQ